MKDFALQTERYDWCSLLLLNRARLVPRCPGTITLEYAKKPSDLTESLKFSADLCLENKRIF